MKLFKLPGGDALVGLALVLGHLPRAELRALGRDGAELAVDDESGVVAVNSLGATYRLAEDGVWRLRRLGDQTEFASFKSGQPTRTWIESGALWSEAGP